MLDIEKYRMGEKTHPKLKKLLEEHNIAIPTHSKLSRDLSAVLDAENKGAGVPDAKSPKSR